MKKWWLVFSVALGFAQQLVPNDSYGVVKVVLTDMKGVALPSETVIAVSKVSGEEFSGVTDNYGELSIHLPGKELLEVSIQTPAGPFKVGNITYPAAPYTGDLQLQFENRNIPLRNVLFDSGKASLKSSSYAELDKLVYGFTRSGTLRVEIAGHTDNVGDDQFNLELSQKRAETVRNYLISKGVEANRVSARGYGETSPVADNNTTNGKARNRRIEMRILSK